MSSLTDPGKWSCWSKNYSYWWLRIRPPASPLPFQTTAWTSRGLWLTVHEDTLTWSLFPSSTMPPLPIPNTPGKTHLRLSVAKQEVSWGEKVWFRVSMLHWERRCIGGGGFGKWRERDWAEKTLEVFFFLNSGGDGVGAGAAWSWEETLAKWGGKAAKLTSHPFNHAQESSCPTSLVSIWVRFFPPQLVSYHVKTCILTSTPEELEPPSKC